MAKKVKRKSSATDYSEPLLSSEVKHSALAILMMALGAIMLLAVFGLAGGVGDWADDHMARFLGISRVVVPVLLMLMGASVVMKESSLVSVRGLLSLLGFILGFNGIANLLFAADSADKVAVAKAGGVVGLLTSDLLVGAMGFWVALIIAITVFLVSVMVLFNASAQSVLGAPLRFLKARESEDVDGEEVDEDEEPAEEDLEETDEEVEEEAEEEMPAPAAGKLGKIAAAFRAKNDEEQVMTTREQRKSTISLDLLDNKRSDGKAGDIERNQEIISKTLEQFGIHVEMSEVRVGPTVAQYAFRPAQGVKLARVVALQNDLALALAAHPIRIEAPIPGKALVGVEVPNQTCARVGLREGMESKEYMARKSNFAVPLGKDISGGTPLLYVEKAPHMLVAGATGSGKSVCLNGIIISLLYQNGPDELKFIMVDPKRVELGVYAGIPHLLVPPIVKADEAVNALKWAVREMERRLDYLSKFGARDIDSYNAKSKEKLPRIVIVIDELADLMIQNKREVEAVIVRIAQMARAAGIHLILATQRPSVDVITGTIKANIPTRLAFAVASQVDSKTILDTAGADKLLGRGDMLMSTPEMSKPRRVQGAFVSDVEIEKVVNFLKKESAPDYNYQITEGGNGGSGGSAYNSADKDELLEDAIKIAIDAGRVSTSFLQRKMKIGYSRAARIVDEMQEMGVVGAADGSKPREVLISEWPPAGLNVGPDEDFDENGAGDDNDESEAPEELDEDVMDEIMEDAEPNEELVDDADEEDESLDEEDDDEEEVDESEDKK
ncbi:MAG: DNA translocase FtsK 4TM domain-containing protein [Patescibacteria group bacterium]